MGFPKYNDIETALYVYQGYRFLITSGRYDYSYMLGGGGAPNWNTGIISSLGEPLAKMQCNFLILPDYNHVAKLAVNAAAYYVPNSDSLSYPLVIEQDVSTSEVAYTDSLNERASAVRAIFSELGYNLGNRTNEGTKQLAAVVDGYIGRLKGKEVVKVLNISPLSEEEIRTRIEGIKSYLTTIAY